MSPLSIVIGSSLVGKINPQHVVIVVVYEGRNWQIFDDGVSEHLARLFDRAVSESRTPPRGNNRCLPRSALAVEISSHSCPEV